MAGFSRFKKTQVKDALVASEKEPEETCSGKETASNFRWLLLKTGVLHNFRYALMIFMSDVLFIQPTASQNDKIKKWLKI